MADAPHRLVEALSGSYRIERELGSGGMAVVYLAEDLEHGRRVEMKVLRPELGYAAKGACRSTRPRVSSRKWATPSAAPTRPESCTGT